MKKTGIMTDSHSGILPEEAERLGIRVLPMPFYIGEKLYREGVDLSRDEFYDMLRKGVDVSTSAVSGGSYRYVERNAERIRGNRLYSSQQRIERFLYGSSGNGK